MSTETRGALVAQLVCQVDHLRTLRVRSICDKPLHRDISLPQLHVLVTLHEKGPMTVSAIAHLFGMSMPSASSISDRMEDRGLVTRVREETDRRVVTVDVTERGREAVEEFVGLQREHLDRLLDAMPVADLEDLSRGIAALQRGIELAAMSARAPEEPQAVLRT